MNYNSTSLIIGELIIVPLAHPDGAPIRQESNNTISIIAKVRSVFSGLVNVINYFGYQYNVHIEHVERMNLNIDINFYVQMIEYATHIMTKYGYQTVNTNLFFESITNSSTYSFLSRLPNTKYKLTNKYVYSPDSANPYLYSAESVTDFASPPLPPHIRIAANINNPIKKPVPYIVKGSIQIMDINTEELLHYIETKGENKILFDKKSGILIIPGYSIFIIESSYTYHQNNGLNTEYQILRSHRNYIHIEKSFIYNARINLTDTDLFKSKYSEYKVETIHPKKYNITDMKYFDIMKIISNEFN